MSDKRNPEAEDLGVRDDAATNFNVASSVAPDADDLDVDVPLDLVTCTVREFSYFLAGGLHFAQAQAAADDEREERRAAELHARAVRVVHAAARLPEVPLERQVPRSWTGVAL